MKIEEYLKHLTELAKAHPNADVVYAIDEEGNQFCPVVTEPSSGFYNAATEEFDSQRDDSEVNAICLN